MNAEGKNDIFAIFHSVSGVGLSDVALYGVANWTAQRCSLICLAFHCLEMLIGLSGVANYHCLGGRLSITSIPSVSSV